MTFLYRGTTIRELIQKLREYDLDTYVVTRSADHSFDHRIDIYLQLAEMEFGGHIGESYPGDENSFNVLVIE